MDNKNFNNIPIPKNLKSSLKSSIKKGFEKKKKFKRNKKYKYLAASLALVASCSFLAFTNESVLATINKITNSLSNLFPENSKAKDYVNIYDKTITKNKITAKLNEVLFDGPYIRISSSFTVPKKMLEGFDYKSEDTNSYLSHNISISINGKNIFTSDYYNNTSIAGNTINLISNLAIRDYNEEEMEAMGASTNNFYALNDVMSMINKNQSIDLEVNFIDFNLVKDRNDNKELNRHTNNNFTFKINVPLKDLSSNSRVFDINKKIEIFPDKFINVRRVVNSPTAIRLFYDKDLSLLNSTEPSFAGFKVYDEYNNLLDRLSIVGGGYEIGDINVPEDCEYKKISDTTKITIVPVYYSQDNSTENSYYENKEKSITINLE